MSAPLSAELRTKHQARPPTSAQSTASLIVLSHPRPRPPAPPTYPSQQAMPLPRSHPQLVRRLISGPVCAGAEGRRGSGSARHVQGDHCGRLMSRMQPMRRLAVMVEPQDK